MSQGVLEIRDAVRNGEAKASETVREALRQLGEIQPELRSLTQILEAEAMEAAERIDRRLASGAADLPLAGVPFTVKDNICTLQGRTTAGSRILETFAAPYPATVVRRLEEAGAVCVGKTNLDEFGMGSSTENSALNVTRNPWSTTHVPGGSSGGAAATSAATRGMIHLGSDTGGSIRQPAACCGVTGFKPTYGRVSRYGLLAFASSLDQIGCLQASAAECAQVLQVMGGRDPMDTTSSSRDLPGGLDALEARVKGLKIGVPKEYFPAGVDAEVEAKVRGGIERFRELGAEIREVSMPHTEHANPVYVLISAAEASSNLARYDGVHYGYRTPDPEDLLDLYARSRVEGFGAEVKRRIMIGTFVLSTGYYEAFYNKACKVRQLIRGDFEAAYQEVDALVCPTSPVPAFAIGEHTDDPLKLYAVDILTVPANLAGVPGVSIPCGLVSAGLPVGLQIYGRPFEDDVILSLAHAFQQATDYHRQPPPICAWQ